MTYLELISKLNNLKKVKPDKKWLDTNREFLLAQISNSSVGSLSPWKSLIINLSSLSKAFAQPVYALGIFVLMLISGALLGQQALSKTKPNDSLYIARIIAENVKVNTTLNTEERNKLALQYASNHAQDIVAILADPEFNTLDNSDEVAKLNTSFNKEVKTAKSRISNLNNSVASRQELAQKNSIKNSIPEDRDIIIADSSKDSRGISISIDKNLVENIASSGEKISIGDKTTGVSEVLKASTTITATTIDLKSSSTLEIISPSAAANTILDEAQKLVDSKDYDQASSKLKEVEEIIK